MSKPISRIQFPEELGRVAGESREYGTSSRPLQRNIPTNRFEEEFLARANLPIGLDHSMAREADPEFGLQEFSRLQGPRMIYQTVGREAPDITLGLEEFEQFQREHPPESYHTLQLQRSNPEEKSASFADLRQEEVRSIREDPAFQRNVDKLIRNSLESKLLADFTASGNWTTFSVKVPAIFKGSIFTYLDLLAYENVANRDELLELTEAKRKGTQFEFLKRISEKHMGLDFVLEKETFDLIERMTKFLDQSFSRGALEAMALKYGIIQNTESYEIIENLVYNPKAKQEILKLMDDEEAGPEFQNFIDRLIQNYLEADLLKEFERSAKFYDFLAVLETHYGKLSSNGQWDVWNINSYLNLLARKNIEGKYESDELGKINDVETLFIFLKKISEEHGGLHAVLGEKSADLNERMENFLLENEEIFGKISRKYGMFQKRAGKKRHEIIDYLINDPESRQEIITMMNGDELVNNPVQKIRLFLENDRNYSLQELKTLAKGYGAPGRTRTRNDVIERLLENPQAQEDLADMISSPPDIWIVKKQFYKNGNPRREILRNGMEIIWNENGRLQQEGIFINGKKEGQFYFAK
jgi:hypothetical protein